MEKKVFTMMLMLLALVLGAVGCSSDDESSEAEMLHPGDYVTLYSDGNIIVKAVYEPISYNDAPEWVKVILNEKDNYYYKYIYLFKGEWKDEAIYFIHTEFDSTMGTFFNKNGEILTMNNMSYSDFFSETFNWKLIYNYKK